MLCFLTPRERKARSGVFDFSCKCLAKRLVNTFRTLLFLNVEKPYSFVYASGYFIRLELLETTSSGLGKTLFFCVCIWKKCENDLKMKLFHFIELLFSVKLKSCSINNPFPLGCRALQFKHHSVLQR